VCTLVLAHRILPGAALCVAANRDEFLSRAASPPRIVPGEPRVLMPRDEVAGGTWLGLNARGLFVGITNRAGTPPDRTRRSRGMLVVESLAESDALSLNRRLASLSPSTYNPFHLLYADGALAFVTWSDGEHVRQCELAPGLHLVTERSLGGNDRGRTERLERLFDQEVVGRAPTLEGLLPLLRVHGPLAEPLGGSCVHADEHGYGTRSGFAFISGPSPRACWLEGHPCTALSEDLAPALSELLAPATPARDRR
jgi:hypothetical protein